MDGSEEGTSSWHPASPLQAHSNQNPQITANNSGQRFGLQENNGNTLYLRAGTIISRENDSGSNGRATRMEETWQDFLRRAPPQDIISRDPGDPMRQAYVRERRAQAIEEARKRRRAVSTSLHRLPPPPPHLTRRDSSSMSPRSPRTSFQSPYSRQNQTHRANLSVDRPLPRLPSFDATGVSPAAEYQIPRWQPDSEVDACPICGRGFTMFFRRHHCRKCGRVVCASCSPHRITIPRQFIVHPPEYSLDPDLGRSNEDEARPEVVDLTGDNDREGQPLQNVNAENNPALGGGQEVRLCNPCVPDPNPLPPPPYPNNNLGGSGILSFPGPVSRSAPGMPDISSGRRRRPNSYAFDGYNANNRAPWPADPFSSTNQNTDGPSNEFGGIPPTGFNGLRSPYGSAPSSSSNSHFSRVPPGWITSNQNGQAYHHRHRSHASTSYMAPRQQALQNEVPLPPTPPPPPPPLREEDECPICHTELPPKGPDGSETARESHVQECIASHLGTSALQPGSQSSPGAAPDAAVAANGSVSSSVPARARASSSQSAVAGGSSAPRARRRTTGIVIYNATEKDCIGGDGSQQECVICFEDFEVGTEMGRLECLCKFHKTCIRQWWERKGPGSCPVHQDGI